MHPEDVKAAIRKRHGTIRAFVDAHGLPSTGVSDLFRGRTSRRVSDAVEAVLQEQFGSINMDSSSKPRRAHRLNAGAK